MTLEKPAATLPKVEVQSFPMSTQKGTQMDHRLKTLSEHTFTNLGLDKTFRDHEYKPTSKHIHGTLAW